MDGGEMAAYAFIFPSLDTCRKNTQLHATLGRVQSVAELQKEDTRLAEHACKSTQLTLNSAYVAIPSRGYKRHLLPRPVASVSE
eukprot:537095-Pelagomonas_calceolata.AAC.9